MKSQRSAFQMVRCAILAAVVFVLARPASAGPISIIDFELEADGSLGFGRVEIDANRALVTVPVLSACVAGFQAPCFGESGHRDVRGVAEVHSGPLRRLETFFAGGFENTYYEYGPSRFTLDLEWDAAGGGTARGGLTIPLPAFAFSVIGEDVVGDPDYPYIFETLDIGQGLFDPQLAAFLGVAPHVAGGAFFWWVEPVLGRPGDFRLGHTHTPRLAIAVPEPALLPLLFVGIGWYSLRRRARARRDFTSPTTR
jgi:hypothetical protein